MAYIVVIVFVSIVQKCYSFKHFSTSLTLRMHSVADWKNDQICSYINSQTLFCYFSTRTRWAGRLLWIIKEWAHQNYCLQVATKPNTSPASDSQTQKEIFHWTSSLSRWRNPSTTLWRHWRLCHSASWRCNGRYVLPQMEFDYRKRSEVLLSTFWAIPNCWRHKSKEYEKRSCTGGFSGTISKFRIQSLKDQFNFAGSIKIRWDKIYHFQRTQGLGCIKNYTEKHRRTSWSLITNRNELATVLAWFWALRNVTVD